MQFRRISINGCLQIFAALGGLGGLYAFYQLLHTGRDILTPTDIRWLLTLSMFGLIGSLLLVFGAFVVLLSEHVLEITARFRDLQIKKGHGYKLTIDSERISHLELVVTSALEGLERRLRVLEEKFGEESMAPYSWEAQGEKLSRRSRDYE